MDFLLKWRFFKDEQYLRGIFNGSVSAKKEVIDMMRCKINDAACTVTVPKTDWDNQSTANRAEWCKAVLTNWFTDNGKPYSENQKLVVLSIVGLLPQKVAEFSIKDGFNFNAENLMGIYYQYYQA